MKVKRATRRKIMLSQTDVKVGGLDGGVRQRAPYGVNHEAVMWNSQHHGHHYHSDHVHDQQDHHLNSDQFE